MFRFCTGAGWLARCTTGNPED